MKRAARLRLLFAASLAGALLVAAQAEAGLTCVPFARSISAVKLMGDAWAWWDAAAGRYHRSHAPAPGAVLVMKRTDRLRHGHVAVVSAVVSSREILLDHANWSPGEIARGERAIDVSASNDWSKVRVWHDDSASYGVHVYPAYGFVHPHGPRSQPTTAESMAPAFKPRPARRDAEAPTPRVKRRRNQA